MLLPLHPTQLKQKTLEVIWKHSLGSMIAYIFRLRQQLSDHLNQNDLFQVQLLTLEKSLKG